MAARAVDGTINPQYGRASCTHSANNGENSWSVNLMETYLVDSVVLYNRQDCCNDRLVGAQVSNYIILYFFGMLFFIVFYFQTSFVHFQLTMDL